MSNEQHVVELLPGYALGASDPDEVEQVEAHLPQCAACRTELAAFQEIANGLPLTIEEVEPRAVLKQRLVSRIQPAVTTYDALFETSRWHQIMVVFR